MYHLDESLAPQLAASLVNGGPERGILSNPLKQKGTTHEKRNRREVHGKSSEALTVRRLLGSHNETT